MAYETISEADRDKIIVRYYKAQEEDLYSHTINKERYETMLSSIPQGAFKDRVTQLLSETNERLVEVTAIIEATKPQLPTGERLRTALEALEI